MRCESRNNSNRNKNSNVTAQNILSSFYSPFFLTITNECETD